MASIIITVLSIQVIALVLATVALHRGVRLWVGVAITPALLAIALMLWGPTLSSPETGPEPRDISNVANFKTRYLAEPDLWGRSIGEARDRKGFLVHPFEGYYMESHPEIEDELWRVQPLNAGLAIMEFLRIPVERDPRTPLGIARYQDAEKRRGVDWSRFFGNQRTRPLKQDNVCRVFFDKTILEYPCVEKNDDPDLAEIKRLPAGSILYQLESGVPPDAMPPSQWTRSRIVIAGVCAFMLTLSAAGLWLSGRESDLT